ncbi:uncharacterized protein METZ01_LOCUS90921, partial [marine metagenome]
MASFEDCLDGWTGARTRRSGLRRIAKIPRLRGEQPPGAAPSEELSSWLFSGLSSSW